MGILKTIKEAVVPTVSNSECKVATIEGLVSMATAHEMSKRDMIKWFKESPKPIVK